MVAPSAVTPRADRPLGVLLASAARHQTTFAGSFASHPAVRLIAVADEPGQRDWVRDANRSLAEKRGLPYTEDLDAALGDPAVDVVSVCPEYTRHSRLAIRALEAGKNVLLDKQPIGMTIAEAEAVHAAASRAATRGQRLTYIHHCLDPAVQRARRAIERGAVGTPRAVSAKMVAFYGPGEDPAIEPTGRWGRAYHPNWWVRGELLHFGAYGIGAARYAMGREIVSVQAHIGCFFNRLHRETGIDDMAHLVVGFDGGGVGTIVVGRAPNRATPGLTDCALRVAGSRGALRADWDDPILTVASATEGKSRHVFPTIEGDTRVIHQFLDAILAGERPLLDHDDALAECRVLLAAYQSAETGHAIALAPTRTGAVVH